MTARERLRQISAEQERKKDRLAKKRRAHTPGTPEYELRCSMLRAGLVQS